MCSVGDDDIEEQENTKFMVPKTSMKISQRVCNKCKTKDPCVVLQYKHAYCKDCFLASTTHKFRSYLGSLKLSHSNDNILIVHNCGHQSTALLHLLRTGLDVSQYKKIKIKPLVLFIEDLHHLSVAERRNVLAKVAEEAENFKFEVYFASFNEYLVNRKVNLTTSYVDLILNEDDHKRLKAVLNGSPNKTSQEEIRDLIRKDLIKEACKFLNCKWALTTHVTFNFASNILTDICLGRGANGLLNSRMNMNVKETLADVCILTPFMDLDIKELAFYNIFNKLNPISHPIKVENSYDCVQSLMKKFVEDLQLSYPSTITTIVKTAEKLTNGKQNADYQLCAFCKCPKETDDKELSSRESTKFSHCLSTSATNSEHKGVKRYEELRKTFANNNENDNYCFRCSEIVKFINK